MDATSIVQLLVLGSVTGFLAGLLGIGGGMIMVPFLTMILDARHFPSDAVIKVAIATSLATIVFTSLSSVRAHHRRGAVRWEIVKALAPGIVVGTLLGAQVVGALPGRLIAAFFAAFIGWSAFRMLRPGVAVTRDGQPRALPSTAGLAATGGVIGTLSAFLGAGGGFLTIPFLTGRNVRIQEANRIQRRLRLSDRAVGHHRLHRGGSSPEPARPYLRLPLLAGPCGHHAGERAAGAAGGSGRPRPVGQADALAVRAHPLRTRRLHACPCRRRRLTAVGGPDGARQRRRTGRPAPPLYGAGLQHTIAHRLDRSRTINRRARSRIAGATRKETA